ncbi:nucleotidyltransferase [Salibacterium halotolerans]|uniref:tRNA(Met) cytidine acetate ligase n=1 Tax=Salibacterium halotolerans TaxID=1884432 RepID=A0A1I5M3P0_9BACI|nr:nucleotidyltransferase [Salibacterium halotolerans]SFP04093.1 Predicted nucleotidyltransferase [Salibacterium halotolerans]
MKAVGLIVEYNPFHNGHYYHLQTSREAADADVVICVMSGYFLQRGEPALLPRRERTEMALQGGADLVVELPYIFSSQHADWFARGAVSILDQLGAGSVCFGSEQGSIEPFLNLFDFLQARRTEYGRRIREYSSLGYSFPKAASLSFQHMAPGAHLPDLSQPNNILGYFYTKAVNELGSSMRLQTIQRMTAGYHDDQLSGTDISSATSIRRRLIGNTGAPETVEQALPAPAYRYLRNYLHSGSPLFEWEKYFPYLQAKALTLPASWLEEIYEAEEGLHHRMQSVMKRNSTFHEFMHAFKTKRYTWTRLQRFATHVLTGTSKAEAAAAMETGQADHIRLLGMNKTGQAYLNTIKKQVDIPMISSLPKDKTPQQKLDEKAAAAYYLPLPPDERRDRWRSEYEQPPLFFES